MSIRNGAAVLLVGALVALTARAADPPQVAPRKNAHALLIGVSVYDNLPKSKHLEGPANDVELLDQMLTQMFHFDPTQIAKLSDKQDKDHRPTRANIQREFARLARTVKEGDQVMILLSGLGSQQPQPAGARKPAPDGLDKIFLPRDAGKWDAAKGTVVNAIRDDEIADWVRAIRDRRATVWLVHDSCHAGSVIRGAGNERTRYLDMTADLGIPRAAIAAALAPGAARPPFQLAQRDRVVALCAAQPAELTVERPMPPRSANGKVHGLLSYAVAQVLTQVSEQSSQPITYEELARRIQARYTGWGRSSPTVPIEGGERDRTIFGDKVWPGRSPIALGGKAGARTINAGSLHGLTPDSILSVAPPIGKGTDRLGYVKVTAARPFESDVVPCEQDGKPAATVFLAAALCEYHFLAAEGLRLRVAVDPIDDLGRRMSADFEKKVREQMTAAAEDSAILQIVEKPEQADWLVRRWSKADDKIILVPAAGWSIGRDNPDLDSFGPMSVGAKMPDWLIRTLERINRAEWVKRLAAGGGAQGSDKGIKVKAELVRYKSKSKDDRKAPIPLPWIDPEVALYDEDLMALRLSNPGRTAIDVTLFVVSCRYGIGCLFPPRGEINRLQPGDSLMVPNPAQKKPYMQVLGRWAGRDYLVILAVKGSGKPIDFSILDQIDLEAGEQRALPPPFPPNTLACPVGQLLRRAATGEGTASGLTRDEMEDYAAILIPLRTHKEKRP